MDAYVRYFETRSSGDDKLRLLDFSRREQHYACFEAGDLKQVSGKDRRTTELSATARARSTAAR